MTQDTIESFIRKYSDKAGLEGFSDVKSTAARASSLGFTSAANSRLAQFWEDFQPTPAHAARYADAYPACFFLPWKGLHRTLNTLDLWFEPAAYYAGAIPGEQLPWLEVFEMQREDLPTPDDLVDLLNPGVLTGERYRLTARLVGAAAEEFLFDDPSIARRYTYFTRGSWPDVPRRQTVRNHVREFMSQFFVVAPRAAFTTAAHRKDWIVRARTDVQALEARTVAPDDPLVVRAVRGGVLVVAAWGDEATELNAVASQLKV